MNSGDPAPDGSHGPHTLVDNVHDPRLADDDRHHLERVLRLRTGDPLTVGDGAGRWRSCVWSAEPEPVSDVFTVSSPSPRLGVGFALIKGGRPEFVVQKLVELGIDDIRPFTAERSVVQWDSDKAARNAERLRRVAREAVMQCRRAWLPTVHEPTRFSDVAALSGAVMADRGGSPIDLSLPLVLVGPEGGWSEAELGCGLPRVGLGGPVLRSETAAMAAGTLLAARRENLA